MIKNPLIEVAKQKALAELEKGSPFSAFDMFAAELMSLGDAATRAAIRRGEALILNDELRTNHEMRDFISACH